MSDKQFIQEKDALVNGLHQCFALDKNLIRSTLAAHGWKVDKVLTVLQLLSPKCQPNNNGPNNVNVKAGKVKGATSSGKVPSQSSGKVPAQSSGKVPAQRKVSAPSSTKVPAQIFGEVPLLNPGNAPVKGSTQKYVPPKGEPGDNNPSKSNKPNLVQSSSKEKSSDNVNKGNLPKAPKKPKTPKPVVQDENKVSEPSNVVVKPPKKKRNKKKTDDPSNENSSIPAETKPITSSMLAPKNAPPIIRSSEVVGVQKKKSMIGDLSVYYNLIKQKSTSQDRIRDFIKYKMKVVVLMRGCPGSGKSTLAQGLLSDSGIKNPDFYIFSADDFFIHKGEYKYVPSRIEEAHKWNQAAVTRALKAGLSPVVVDNTHIQVWEMEAVARLAVKYGYIIEIVEPSTPWFFNESILSKKTVHGVPKAKIEEMLGRYEANITGSVLLQKFNLEYNSSLSPPQIVKEADDKAIKGVRRQVPPASTKSKVVNSADSTASSDSAMENCYVESIEFASSTHLMDIEDPCAPNVGSPLTPTPLFVPPSLGTKDTNYFLLSQITGPLDPVAAASETSKSEDLSDKCLKIIQPLMELFPDTSPKYLWQLYKDSEEDMDLAISKILESAEQSEEDSDSDSSETDENDSEEVNEYQEEADDNNDFSGNLSLFTKLFPSISQNIIANILRNAGEDLGSAIAKLNSYNEELNNEKSSNKDDAVSAVESNLSLSSVKNVLQDIVVEMDKTVESTNESLSWEANQKSESSGSFPKKKRPVKGAETSQEASTNTNYRKKFVAPGDANDVLNFTVNDESYSEHVRKIRKQRLGIVDEDNVKEDELKNNDAKSDEIEDDLEQLNVEDMVTFAVDTSLVSQLQEMFGGMIPGSNNLNKIWVNLPIDLARQLHSYVIDSVYNNLDDESMDLVAVTDEDEMLARQIQEMEGGLPDTPGIPTLQEIMDTELALSLHQSLNKDKSKRDTIAGKLSEQLLIERFPNMDPAALKAILTDADHSLHQATQILEVAGYTPKSVQKAFSVQEPEENHISREEVIQQASAYKEAAKVLFELRNECLAKAQKAYGDGLKSVASYYSQMAQWHEQRLGEANVLASSLLLSNSKDGLTLDLHFLRVQDAIQVLDLFLDAQINSLGESRQRRKELYVITGRGLHSSGGKSKIRPAVLNRLKKRAIQSEPVNPGLLKVTISPKTALTCQNI